MAGMYTQVLPELSPFCYLVPSKQLKSEFHIFQVSALILFNSLFFSEGVFERTSST